MFSGFGFYPLVKKNQDSNGRDYELPVPFDRDFSFSVRPVRLSVVDSNNASVDNGQSLRLKYTSNGPGPTVLNYRVTGGK